MAGNSPVLLLADLTQPIMKLHLQRLQNGFNIKVTEPIGEAKEAFETIKQMLPHIPALIPSKSKWNNWTDTLEVVLDTQEEFETFVDQFTDLAEERMEEKERGK